MIDKILLEEINYKVNMMMTYRTDLEKHGKKDKWQSAIETLSDGSGDCEDYAILKMHYLLKAGCDKPDMRIGYFVDPSGLGHAMLICKSQCKGGFMWRKWVDCEYLLDNRTSMIYKLGETRDKFVNNMAIGKLADVH